MCRKDSLLSMSSCAMESYTSLSKQEVYTICDNYTKFYDFMMAMSAMVRSIQNGAEVEDYLDKKLDRRRSEHITVPSFIAEDPDLDA